MKIHIASHSTVTGCLFFFSCLGLIPTGATAQDTIAPGYDLYQEGGFTSGLFLNTAVEGFPIGQFDFGSGPVSTGQADTIVRRTAAASESGPFDIPIEIHALSLKSVAPLDLSPHAGFGDIYITLSAPSLSGGSYNALEFFGLGQGLYQAQFLFDYEVRFNAPDGPVIQTGPFQPGSMDLLSNFPTLWEHFPSDDPADRVIPGVNSLLNGSDPFEDFFLSQNNALVMSNQFFGNNTELTFTHANAIEGEQPDLPVLPTGQQGEGFVFQDVSGDGNWFDPPATNGYSFATTDGSQFVSVGLPPLSVVADANATYTVSSTDGIVNVASGASHVFGSPVSQFTITGIDPAVDGGDPTAFPTFLTFNQSTVSFTMTPIPIPEPTTASLLAFSLAIVSVGSRIKR